MRPLDEDASNQTILLVCLWRLGGAERVVDVEDIAVEAHRIRPGRFSWSRHRDQIDLEKVRSTLRYLSRPAGGALIEGSTRSGWRLTAAGCAAAEKLDGTRPSDPRAAERRRLLGEPALRKLLSGRAAEITPAETASFFRFYDTRDARAKSAAVRRTLAFLAGDPELDDPARRLAALAFKENLR